MNTRATHLSPDARALLDAVTAMSSDLDLHKVLNRIVTSACSLTGARYGALGIIGKGGLSDFIAYGITEEERRRIGDPPHGRGILGLLITHPSPLRLANLQDHAASYGFPANHPPMTSFLGMPVLIRGTVFGNLYLTEKAGGAAFTEADERLLETLATAAGHVIENARAYAVSELQRSWLETASRLNDALRPGITMAEALDLVAVATRTVSRARGVAVVRSDGHGGVEVLARDGRDADAIEALMTDHIEAIIAAGSGENPPPTPLPSGGHLLALPLRTHLATSLVLVVRLDEEGRDLGLGRSELDLVMSFGDQVALALDRVQALAEREQLAIVSDRDRIARDLHDLVIQRLFATGLQLQGVRSQVVSPVVADRIDQAVTDLDTTIRDIRGTIFQLQQEPPTGLRTQMAALTREYREVLGITPDVRISGPVDSVVSEVVTGHLMAVLREALSNVARHSGADRVCVDVSATDSSLVLRVEDNGRGVTGPGSGNGLPNVRRRAEALDGTVRVMTASPSGTVLEWQVPLSR